jgi:hypothetical protein
MVANVKYRTSKMSVWYRVCLVGYAIGAIGSVVCEVVICRHKEVIIDSIYQVMTVALIMMNGIGIIFVTTIIVERGGIVRRIVPFRALATLAIICLIVIAILAFFILREITPLETR